MNDMDNNKSIPLDRYESSNHWTQLTSDIKVNRHQLEASKLVVRDINKVRFVGPTVDEGEQEYVKVMSGKATYKKPSFA